MKRITLLLATLLALAACTAGGATATTAPVTTTVARSTTSQAITTTTGDPGFPVTVSADNGSVTIEARPQAIISLSAVATEMFFAIGAGPQVVAVDDQSNFPPDAPVTDLSGFTPNIEAILSYQPDLVVITFDPGDLVASLEAAGIPVLSYTAAATIDDVYRQIDALGQATGNQEEASAVSAGIESGLADVVAGTGGAGEGVTYYHEIDNTLYTVTSSTFFGEIYGLFGMVNIADAADEDGSAFGYPQLSSEYIVADDPDIIFLADVLYGESAETVAERPGWAVMTAVQNGDIVELDSDVASRWGPRIVDLARDIAAALETHGAG
ncbi:MAG: ABC transporter substrate-binding protein [Acidimicrobiia bacterium]